MRKEFSERIEEIMSKDNSTIFLTADLGYRALENVRDAIGDRFINVGVAEQNMISIAAGLASEGLTPICYSIAPFVVFRPAEQTRLDICVHNMNVKIVGNGGGYNYGVLGASHHALEDFAIMSSFPNMLVYAPWCNDDVSNAVISMMKRKGPVYLRLGHGYTSQDVEILPWQPIRKICLGDEPVTIVGVGPVILNVLSATRHIDRNYDIFVVSELPCYELTKEFKESIERTQNLLIVEEHVVRGGLGEMLGLMMLKEKLCPNIHHYFAIGYPDGVYGSQAYHQKKSGLDEVSMVTALESFLK